MDDDRPRTTTEIAVAGANCPWCFNETVDALLREPGVTAVGGSITEQYLRVEHQGLDVAALIDVVRRHLHADELSSAEHTMVQVDPRIADIAHPHHGASRGHR